MSDPRTERPDLAKGGDGLNEDEPTPELIDTALDLEELDVNLYRSKNLWRPVNGRGVFGGQVIAQAAWAATSSVDRRYHLHSLHCYFLSFGDAEFPILYHVDRLRDGKSYCTRSVKAVQRGKCIFTLTCSFQVPEPTQPIHQYGIFRDESTDEVKSGPSAHHHKDISTIPRPEDCLPTEARFVKILEGNPNLPAKIKDYLQRGIDERRQSSIEIRNADLTSEDTLLRSKRGPSQTHWIRSRAKVRDDPAFQKCVLAYASDFSLIGTAAKALGLSGSSNPRLSMLASLDHSMYFYDDTVDASDWLLYHMDTPRAASGRGVVHGKIYKKDGTLAVVVTQEGVVRGQTVEKKSKL